MMKKNEMHCKNIPVDFMVRSTTQGESTNQFQSKGSSNIVYKEIYWTRNEKQPIQRVPTGLASM